MEIVGDQLYGSVLSDVERLISDQDFKLYQKKDNISLALFLTRLFYIELRQDISEDNKYVDLHNLEWERREIIDKNGSSHIGYLLSKFKPPIVTNSIPDGINDEFKIAKQKEVIKLSQELNKVKNLLKIKNELLDYELEMAYKTQNKSIPLKLPNSNISFYYKSTDNVGGNFFDFIQFYDSNTLGIFISDISSHGITSVLLKSMLKSLINQNGKNVYKPSELMMILNNELLNNTGSNFITALYGIYDNDKKTLNYAIAGHASPFMINSGGATILKKSISSIPLAILSNQEMKSLNKDYQNN